MVLRSFILLLCISCLQKLQGQDSLFLKIYNPADDREIGQIADFEGIVYETEAERNNALNIALYELYNSGYLTASFSEVENNNGTLTVLFNKGKKIKWAELNVTTVDEIFLNGAGYRKKDFENKIFRYDEISAFMQRLLVYSENHGYPFALVKLDSIQWHDSTITASLVYRKNQLILFDTLRIVGNLQLSNNYLKQYTGIEAGNIYDQQLLNDLDNRLREIIFASVTHTSKVEFAGNSAKVIVYLDEKKSSRFDLLIGVIPNDEIKGRLIITGEGRIDLQNLFGAGEIFNFHFSKLESTSKELQTHLTYPYLPGVPIGVEGDFNLFLKDSTFLERSSTAGILYQLTGNDHVKAFVSFYNSTVLSIDTAAILLTKTLPLNLDLSQRSYGLAWNYEQLNYRFNPRSGYAITLSGSAGNKTIRENNSITSLTDPAFPDYDFASLYDSIDTRTISINYKYDVRFFIPLFKRNTILLQARGASMISDLILQNELFRIGGNALLRGFDEQSIFVSDYYIFTTELRYLLSQNSYASLFADGGYVKNRSNGQTISDTPFGFGAGISFETKAGIFGLSYALGMQQNNPISLKNTKIHFGYVNYF
ncbi:MAG: BamA/TamA family outer membrane protein [Chitinophagales bacterium]